MPRLHADGLDPVDFAKDETRLGLKFARFSSNVLKLAHTRKCAHRDALNLRIADDDLGKPRHNCRFGGVQIFGRNEGATNGSTLLSCLRRHLADDFLHEKVKFRGVRGGVGPQHGCIERVTFGDEAHRFPRNDGMRLQLLRGIGRAGERYEILASEVIEQVAHWTDHELKRARRQDIRFNHDADRCLGDIGSGRCRLHDNGHSSK